MVRIYGPRRHAGEARGRQEAPRRHVGEARGRQEAPRRHVGDKRRRPNIEGALRPDLPRIQALTFLRPLWGKWTSIEMALPCSYRQMPGVKYDV